MIKLTFEVFDADRTHECVIYVNGGDPFKDIGKPEYNDVWTNISLDITRKCVDGSNWVTIYNATAEHANKIKNLKITHNGTVVLDEPAEWWNESDTQRDFFFDLDLPTPPPPPPNGDGDGNGPVEEGIPMWMLIVAAVLIAVLAWYLLKRRRR